MTMNSCKVIPINRSTGAELLEELSEKCTKDEVTDLIVMARFKDSTTISHWFGHESSFRCLGMAHYMADRISGYIEESD